VTWIFISSVLQYRHYITYVCGFCIKLSTVCKDVLSSAPQNLQRRFQKWKSPDLTSAIQWSCK
jgi:hypothetical protein